jgi:putative spermidine/putrescine transport system permease protein
MDKQERRTDVLGGSAPSALVITFAWLAFFYLLLPSIIIIPMSFGDTREIVFPPANYTLALYKEYFTNPTWTGSTIQSIRIAIVATIVGLALGTSAAYGIVRGTFRGKVLLGALLLSPFFVPAVVKALGFYIYFARLGIQGTTLSVILGHILFVTPYVMIVMMAALRNVDPQIESAGMIMGASRFYVFRKITLPMLRNALVAAGLFAFLMSFDEMIIAFFLSGFGTATLPVKMYESIVHEVSPVLSAISALLTVLALVVCLAVTALSGRGVKQTTH